MNGKAARKHHLMTIDDAHDSTNKNETVYIAINSDQIKRLV